jgi:2,4-diketo-3-deoxy-L-fuconate hydrolase
MKSTTGRAFPMIAARPSIQRADLDDDGGHMPPVPRYALARYAGADGMSFGAVVVDDEVVALADLDVGAVEVEDLLADWAAGIARLEKSLEAMTGSAAWSSAVRGTDGLTPLPPVVPGQVFQSGANYTTHVSQLMVAAAVERGEDRATAARDAAELMTRRATEGTPYVFLGLPSSMGGPVEDVVLPPIGQQHDWELELGVVIGREAHRVGRQQAMDHVAAYVMVNDLTTRDRVFRPDMPGLGTDWLAGKNAPGFLPTGPWLVPAHLLPDVTGLRITLALNGETMQDETTADMIFDIPRLIEHVSAITPMRPGDLLLTGSPAGNGAHYGRFLRDGDVMTGAITGLGTQRTRCVSA